MFTGCETPSSNRALLPCAHTPLTFDVVVWRMHSPLRCEPTDACSLRTSTQWAFVSTFCYPVPFLFFFPLPFPFPSLFLLILRARAFRRTIDHCSVVCYDVLLCPYLLPKRALAGRSMPYQFPMSFLPFRPPLFLPGWTGCSKTFLAGDSDSPFSSLFSLDPLLPASSVFGPPLLAWPVWLTARRIIPCIAGHLCQGHYWQR